MATQFVKVVYPTTRKVNVDHLELGDTGETLKMDAGHRIFDLGAPVDYMPGTQTVRIGGTTKDNPKLIFFTPVVALTEMAHESMPAPRLKMAKRVGGERAAAPAKKAATKVAKTVKKAGKQAAKKAQPKTAKKEAKKSAQKGAKKL